MEEPKTSCRGCLEVDVERTKNVEDYWHDDLKFIQLLNFLMGSDGSARPNLPEQLCAGCEKSLIAAYLFKRQVCEVERRFLEAQTEGKMCVAELQDEDFLAEDADEHGQSAEEAEPQADNSRKPTCLKCKTSFETNKEYQLHYRTMHRERTVCSQCGKMVIRHNLEKHQLCHSKIKRHACDECGRSFTLIENLRKHVRIHTGDHRYECEHCGKKFIHWNSKRCHIRTQHTGEMNYECSVCGKKFAHSSNMLRHVRYHTGELLHECQHCSKKFNTTSELRDHLVTHTKERNEICEICSKGFGTRKALRNHQKTHLRNPRPDHPMLGNILTRKKLNQAATPHVAQTK